MDANVLDYYFDEALGISTPLNLPDEVLDRAAKQMTAPTSSRSDIPAGYTYFGQFVDHDLSRDERNRPLTEIQTRGIRFRNSRTPFFDLDVLYAHETGGAGQILRRDLMADEVKLKLGETDPEKFEDTVFQNDIPRKPDGEPILLDPRNDENLAVAQIHVAFIKFHNALASDLGAKNKAGFEEVRRLVIKHYQWIVLNDFLPRVVKADVLKEALDGVRVFYPAELDETIMPLEFSVGAYRFGHSMIRNVYQWNRQFSGDLLSDSIPIERLMRLRGKFRFDGRNLVKLPSEWVINWKWFFDIDGSARNEAKRFNFAQAIDPIISSRLGSLPPAASSKYVREASLPALDLFRARANGLPSGQAIARAIAERSQSAISVNIISEEMMKSLTGLCGRINAETPVWLYLLSEAQIETGGKTLGTVGSRIVAETMLELLTRSEFSIVGEAFERSSHFLGTNGRFEMADLLKFADRDGDLIDPVGHSKESISIAPLTGSLNTFTYEISKKEKNQPMKIIDKINQIHCEIYSDPTGEGGKTAERLQKKATAIILGSEDHETAMKKYMSEFVVNGDQLQRLIGKDDGFNAHEWSDKVRAYMVSNSTCGIDTGTGTRNNMTLQMIESLDYGVSEEPDDGKYPIE